MKDDIMSFYVSFNLFLFIRKDKSILDMLKKIRKKESSR